MKSKDRIAQITPRQTMTRRTLLKCLAALGIGLSSGISIAKNKALIQRRIPSSGEMLSAIGLGTARTFDVGTEAIEREDVKQVLRLFVKQGGQLVDSSPMYGTAETVTGDLATELGIQKKLFYATKVWTRGRDEGIQQMQTSMRRMRSKRMDLMQIHNLVDWRTHIKTLYDWKEKGEIRYIGITHYVNSAFGDLEQIMRKERLDFVQLPYSIANRKAEKRLLPLAADRGIAVIVNVPFERGALFRQTKGKPLPAWAKEFDCSSWAQFFLKFLLSHPTVTCPIPATSKPAHLLDNMQAMVGRLPQEKQRPQMVDYLQSL